MTFHQLEGAAGLLDVTQVALGQFGAVPSSPSSANHLGSSYSDERKTRSGGCERLFIFRGVAVALGYRFLPFALGTDLRQEIRSTKDVLLIRQNRWFGEVFVYKSLAAVREMALTPACSEKTYQRQCRLGLGSARCRKTSWTVSSARGAAPKTFDTVLVCCSGPY